MQKSLNKILDHKYSPFKGPGGKAYFALFNICFIWGTTWNVVRIAKDYMHPLQLAGLRQIAAGAIFIVYFLAQGHKLPNLRQLWQAFYISIFLFVFSNGFTSWGMKYVSSGMGAIIGALSPLVIPFMAALFGEKQKLNLVTIIGLVLGALGVAVIFYDHLQDFLNPEFRFGIILLFIAVFAWSFGTILIMNKQRSMNAYHSTGWQMMFAGILMTVWAEISGYSRSISGFPWQAWAALWYLIIFGSVVTFISYVYALKKLPVAQVSIYAYINPIVAIIIGWLFMGEELTVYIVTGALVILLGVYLVNRNMQQKAKQIIEEAEAKDQSQ